MDARLGLRHVFAMKLATFNINGIKARLPRLKEWLEETRPSVACLQEIKSQDEGFPAEEFEAIGYQPIWHGQKAFNGVAILADTKANYSISEVQRGLGINGPKEGEGEQARYLEVDVRHEGSHVARVVGIYLPNGNPQPGPKFEYKLAWMEKLRTRMATIWEEDAEYLHTSNIPHPVPYFWPCVGCRTLAPGTPTNVIFPHMCLRPAVLQTGDLFCR